MAAPSFMVQMLPMRDIFVVGVRRPLNEGAVETLMNSISKIGLLTPITVRVDPTIIDPETGEVLGGFAVVTGAHRFEAYRRLGHDSIPAIERDCDEIDARLWEIAENLHRAELTILQRDEQIAEWIVLTEKKVLSQVATKPHGGRPESGVRAAARELGVDKDQAYRAKSVASISDRAKAAARDAGLDNNRSALLRIASSKGADEQVAAVRAIAERKRVLTDAESIEKQVQAIVSAWNRAGSEARDIFKAEYIDAPVMDARFG